VQLIDRSKRPFVLTPQGECYHQGCRRLMVEMEALEDEVKALNQQVVGRVGIASIYSIGLHQLSIQVKSFLNDYPRANVKLEYQHPTRVYELIEGGLADIGFVSYPKSTKNLIATLWQEEPMTLVCAPQHPLASEGEVEFRRLDGADFIAFNLGLKVRTELDRLFLQFSIAPRVAMELDNIETIKRAVEINAGISLLPAPTVEREVQLGTLCQVPLADAAPTRPIGIIQRQGSPMGKTTRLFLDSLGIQPGKQNSDSVTNVPVSKE
jgi:DNA-binding transcriptional LysR family regulator